MNAYAPPPPAEVTVAHPIRKQVTRYLEYTGTTEPYEAVELRARVSGFLDQVNFKPGASVKKGDLLFVIDPRVYEAQERQAEAELSSRQAALRLSEVTFQHVSEARQASAVAQLELDRAEGARDQDKAQVALAEAALATARLNVEFTQVRAPIDGRITKNLVDVGNLVGAGNQPTVLATIVSAKPLYVTVDASESDVLMVRRTRLATVPAAEPGQISPGVWRPVDLATADSDEFGVHGHIDYVDPALNPQTGTIRVRTRFENEDAVLLPGLFVRLRVFLDTADQIVVPDIALPADQNGRFALVVNDKDGVELRRVKTGALDGTLRVITEGLSETDRVIVNGFQRARPGMTVKPSITEIESVRTGESPVAPDGAPHV
jgi:RND family efflux transporter MFP subunit